ncbi:MAG: HipA domain-containing protein [Legionellaceae bacterium]|nr:HipA domain-containing protein [Legionellaceae bacterium]
MSGNKPCLDVYLGTQVIARLMLIEEQFNWHYTDTWRQTGYAISPHLPLTGNIPSLHVQRLLRNYLPEGQGLEALLHTFHLSKYNTFGLVRALGLDMPGALIMLMPTQHMPLTHLFREISDAELEERLNTRNEFNMLVWDQKPRLSVAGVQAKINVILNNKNQLGFGEGGLCSTHLLKFEKHKYTHLVLNEFISMKLAKYCGLDVANVELKRYGQHQALLVERFDRKFISMGDVKRRHVIDGCQALNVSPDDKYERNFGSGQDVAHIRDGASLVRLFKFAEQCLTPALVKQQMLDWVLFNLMIFNCDAHGKNISFFVGPQGVTLAPFYDLVNIKMYPDFDQEMAMGLGDEFDMGQVHAYQLADFADTCQLPRLLVVKRLKHMIKKLLMPWPAEIKHVVNHDEEIRYVQCYQSLVRARCEYLLEEADDIVGMTL